jgi:hypothetical protein
LAVEPVIEIPAPTPETPTLTFAPASEVAAGVSAAEVVSQNPPGANAAETSASTLAVEPVIEIPAPTPETSAPTYAPVLPASPSTTEQPDNPTTAPQAPSVSEVAADVPALSGVEGPAAEVAGQDQPGTNAAETPASTLAVEPEFEITSPSPSTT